MADSFVTDPRDLSLSSYDYFLDSNLIAQTPLEPRHSARLLIAQEIERPISFCRHAQVWDLYKELRPGDLVVVNNTARGVVARNLVDGNLEIYNSHWNIQSYLPLLHPLRLGT